MAPPVAADDELLVKVLREGQPQEIRYTLKQQRPLVPVLHGVDCVPSYFIVGGLVFVPLSIPFLEHAYGCAPLLPAAATAVTAAAAAAAAAAGCAQLHASLRWLTRLPGLRALEGHAALAPWSSPAAVMRNLSSVLRALTPALQ